MGFFSFEKPPFWDHPDAPGTEHVSYRRMWRTNFTVAVLVTMLPLISLAALGLFQMNWLDQMERGRQKRAVEAGLTQGRDYLDARVRERTAALELAASFMTDDKEGLDLLFRRLSQSMRGFSALALAGSRGKIRTTAGQWTVSGLDPARLAGRRAVLLAATLSGGEALVLGVRPGGRAAEAWLLAQVSNRQLFRAPEVSRPWPQSAVFLVDQKGRVLTSAGEGPARPGVTAPQGGAAAENGSMLTGRLKLKGLPLWLVSQTPLSALPSLWGNLKTIFIISMALCLLIMLIMIHRATVNQVTRLYQAHLEQAQVLREIVYTQKLASIGRLASGVGHQINNPVAVINEKAGLLHDLITYSKTSPDPERLAGLVRDIQNMVHRIGSITPPPFWALPSTFPWRWCRWIWAFWPGR